MGTITRAFGAKLFFSAALFACTSSVAVAAVTTVASADASTRAPRLLILGQDGNLYGACDYECLFEATPAGAISRIATVFMKDDVTTFIQASNGTFYGGTSEFLFPHFPHYGGGVFKFTPGSEPTTFANLDTLNADTVTSLIMGTDGNLYGTAQYGGTGIVLSALSNRGGDIFRVTPTGKIAEVASFSGHETGVNPGTAPIGLLQGRDGNLYGWTQSTYDTNLSTIFRVVPTPGPLPAGGELTTLASFFGNGVSGLVEGDDGNLYASLASGGSYGYGALIRVTPKGAVTTLVNFTGPSGNGQAAAQLRRGVDGNLYGLANTNPCCSLFRLTLSGQYTQLDYIPGAIWFFPDAVPYITSLVAAPDGSFYATGGFGALGYGSVVHVVPDKPLTKLAAQAVILTISPTQIHLKMKAVLNAAGSSQPLPGKIVRFNAPGGLFLCSGVTDAAGTASCGTVVTYVRDVVNLGYLATFDGDAGFVGSTSRAGLIQ